jgi:hypothetical protein
MDLKNKNIINTSDSFTKDFKEKIKLRVSDRFDPSIIGKIDLFEAEEIAKEEGLFLTENDIMEGLEDFELVPVKSGRELKTERTQETRPGLESMNLAVPKDNFIDSNKNLVAVIGRSSTAADSLKPSIDDAIEGEPVIDSPELNTIDEILDSEIIILEEDKTAKEDFPDAISDGSDSYVIELDQTDQVSEPIADIEKVDPDNAPADLMIETAFDIDEIEILPDALEVSEEKKVLPDELEVSEEKEVIFDEIKVSDEIEILPDEIELYEEKEILSDEIKVSEEKEDSEEIKVLDDDQIRIIEELEDHEVLLLDEKTFIQKIGDEADFDSFASEKYQSKREISEILGLIPEEKDYINDKLFGEYYKKSAYNLDQGKADAGAGAIKDESSLIDITDEIVILEDKEKLLEFTSEFAGKGDHLVKLLSYLDGLFEKLPEDVIRKFAESEYFDLYTKILKDMEL